jgi:hypothetical protein
MDREGPEQRQVSALATTVRRSAPKRANEFPSFGHLPLQAAEPTPAQPAQPGMFDWLLPARRRAPALENDRRNADYARALERFELEKEEHRASNQSLRMLHSAAMAGNPEPMQQLLELRLNAIVWPKETSVALEVR